MVRNELFSNALDYLYKNGLVAGQRELSEKTGITETTISRILNNKVRQPSEETLRRLNAAFGFIFNPRYFRGESKELLAEQKESAPEIEDGEQPSIMALYAQLIHEVEQLRTELNTQLREVKDVREQLTQERKALQNISQQLTATLMGARGQYPIASAPLPLAADGTPLSPMCGAPQCPVTFPQPCAPQPCAPTLPVGSPSHPTESTTNK